ncbi:TPA: hypothetical protein L3V69_000545 [Vibrio parahaemolyticus]|uniref:hypothetical protein n=1 Tax=Vibrio parahaemolyticus TaxID=670 RepID=UPI00387AD566|nr:hypothetical protein [Vibrio parahaemolyticus]HBN6315539.1 hypothetical protein [Vibrio parahaemolyticus]HCD5127987.1 hypothetical protein [Vibrio parahaemolyticus]HCD5207059.1 hypothetical protein [Vibrio parahaemolyticus]
MNMTETKTLEDFINEYYDNVQLSTFTEKDVQDVYDTCMCRYDTTVSKDFRLPPISGNELEQIQYKLTSCNLLYDLGIGSIEAFTLSPYKRTQDMLVEFSKKLELGYSPVPSSKLSFAKFNKNSKYVGFIAYKPDQLVEQELELLRAQIKDLLIRKCELENEELLAPEEAKAYALQKLAEQEEEQEQALHLRAAKAAAAAKEKLLSSSNVELTELLKRDWVTFENVKEVSGESNNAKVENLLTENSFVKKRKYISDKQAVIWIREGKESEIDFKAITL